MRERKDISDSMNNISQRQNVSKEPDFKKGFEDAYLNGIKTSLDERLVIDLTDADEHDHYYNKNYKRGSESYEQGKQLGSQIIGQRIYAQELAREKLPKPESDYKIGFAHGYNTQQKFPELAIKERNQYEDAVTKSSYQEGYIEGSAYYLMEVKENNRDPNSESLELDQYNKQYFGGHIAAVIDYRSNYRQGVINDVRDYMKNSKPSSYERGYIDGHHFSKDEKELYGNQEFNSGFVEGYNERLKGHKPDFDYWEGEFKEGLYAGKEFRSERYWHMNRVQANAIEVEENIRSQKGINSEISTVELMLIEDKSEFKEGFSHGYNMQQSIPKLAHIETKYYTEKNTKSIYEEGYISGAKFGSNGRILSNKALHKQTYKGITYEDMSKTSEIPKEALHHRDKLMSEMTFPKYQERYSLGVNDAQEHYKNDPQNALENTFFYRREDFFPGDINPTYVEPSSPYELGYVEGVDKLERGKQNLIDGNKKTQIVEKAKAGLDKIKQAIEKYRPIERSSDKETKEKDHDKGMDI